MDLGHHLDLANTEIQERHAVPNFDDTLRPNTSHRRPEPTVQLEHSELVEDGRVHLVEDLVSPHLLRVGRVDFLPFPAISARSPHT